MRLRWLLSRKNPVFTLTELSGGKTPKPHNHSLQSGLGQLATFSTRCYVVWCVKTSSVWEIGVCIGRSVQITTITWLPAYTRPTNNHHTIISSPDTHTHSSCTLRTAGVQLNCPCLAFSHHTPERRMLLTPVTCYGHHLALVGDKTR